VRQGSGLGCMSRGQNCLFVCLFVCLYPTDTGALGTKLLQPSESYISRQTVVTAAGVGSHALPLVVGKYTSRFVCPILVRSGCIPPSEARTSIMHVQDAAQKRAIIRTDQG
jgi:hypothetical protein